ncbi:unnamed protein product [Phytophthora fragariaefolia]|uniref:Unnamed protein product n=1 Tax=Phytophthora fragariaefolia TaxID=1490495 RepID=A0A9W6UC32_9STRA|nr:unnamed protein product [Phytophthora fragariaefolia]
MASVAGDVEVAAREPQERAPEAPVETSHGCVTIAREKRSFPCANCAVIRRDGDAAQQFEELYMSKLLAKLRESNKTPQAAAAELQNALNKLHALQQEFVAKQAKQNLLDRLAQVETLEALQKAVTSRRAQAEAGYEQEKRELQGAVQERQDALRLLERLADEVEQEKRNVIEHEGTQEAHESELAQLNEVWKEIQKRNAHRKAAVQVATGVMITDEEDCSRVLDQQTQSIQEMHQKQKLLEVGLLTRRRRGVF